MLSAKADSYYMKILFRFLENNIDIVIRTVIQTLCVCGFFSLFLSVIIVVVFRINFWNGDFQPNQYLAFFYSILSVSFRFLAIIVRMNINSLTVLLLLLFFFAIIKNAVQ